MDANVNLDLRTTGWADYSGSAYKYKEGDYVEVTEWTNGDGVDITISSSLQPGNRTVQLTYEELELINKIIDKFNQE